MKKDCRKKQAAEAKGSDAVKGADGGKKGDWNQGGWQRKGGWNTKGFNPKGFKGFSKGDWSKGGSKGGKGLMSLLDGDPNSDYGGYSAFSWGLGGSDGGHYNWPLLMLEDSGNDHDDSDLEGEGTTATAAKEISRNSAWSESHNLTGQDALAYPVSDYRNYSTMAEWFSASLGAATAVSSPTSASTTTVSSTVPIVSTPVPESTYAKFLSPTSRIESSISLSTTSILPSSITNSSMSPMSNCARSLSTLFTGQWVAMTDDDAGELPLTEASIISPESTDEGELYSKEMLRICGIDPIKNSHSAQL